MEFYAYHGVLEQEKTVGNVFRVDVRFRADISKAIQSDNVDDTINYAEVYELVKQEMQKASNLLEHVAGRILHSLKKQFPQISEIKIGVTKVTPPIEGQLAYVKVEVED